MNDNLQNITLPKKVLDLFKMESADKFELSNTAKAFERFLGKVDQIIAEKNELKKEVGDLKEELETVKCEKNYDTKYRLLLSVRSRIERLELIFRAKELVSGKKCNRTDTWLTIFDLGNHRMLNDLKKRICDNGLTIEEFSDAVGIIYGDFSDRAVHGVALPKEIKEANIKDLVDLLDVDNDEQVEKTLGILVNGLNLVNSPSKKDYSSDNYEISFDRSTKHVKTSQ